MSDLHDLDLSYYGNTREQIEQSIFFPTHLVMKYKARIFFKAWKHMQGFETATKRQLNELCKYGLFIKYKLSEEDVVSLLKNKEGQRIHGSGSEMIDTCDWCHGETYTLHKHHYPIPKRAGGTVTVDVCANCHYEFHILTETFQYSPSVELQENFLYSKKRKQDILNEFDRRAGGAQ